MTSAVVDSFARFHERLKIAIGCSKIVEFAKECGFGESLIRQYLSGKTIPGADKLVAMAKAADVSIEWLATGEGPMRSNKREALPQPQLNTAKLKAVLTIVKDIMEEDDLLLTPSQEAEMVTGIYELIGDNVLVPRNAIIHLLKAYKQHT